ETIVVRSKGQREEIAAHQREGSSSSVGPFLGLQKERHGQVKPGDDIPALRQFQRISACATPGVQNPRPKGNPPLGEEGGDACAVAGDRTGDEQIIGPPIGAVKWSVYDMFHAGHSPVLRPHSVAELELDSTRLPNDLPLNREQRSLFYQSAPASRCSSA